jgi:hypothetical protein
LESVRVFSAHQNNNVHAAVSACRALESSRWSEPERRLASPVAHGDDALTYVAGSWGRRSQGPIETCAVRAAVGRAVAVTAVVGARIASLISPAAKRIPAAIVCCAANSRGMYMGTVVRASDRSEHDAHECRGREGEGEMAQHGHFLTAPLQVRISSSLCLRVSILKGPVEPAPATRPPRTFDGTRVQPVEVAHASGCRITPSPTSKTSVSARK